MDREVLPLPVEVYKFEVDQLDALVLDLTKDVLGCFGHDDERKMGRPGGGWPGPYGATRACFVSAVTKALLGVAVPLRNRFCQMRQKPPLAWVFADRECYVPTQARAIHTPPCGMPSPV